jgi:hypothetical protein
MTATTIKPIFKEENSHINLLMVMCLLYSKIITVILQIIKERFRQRSKTEI